MTGHNAGPGEALFRYRRGAIRRDFALASIGIAAMAWILIGTGAQGIFAYVAAAAMAGFGWIGWRANSRLQVRLRLDADGIGPDGAPEPTIRWTQLDGFRLLAFPGLARRDQPTLHLTLHAGENRLEVDSDLDEFETLLRFAWGAARRNGLDVTAVTRANLRSLGLVGDE